MIRVGRREYLAVTGGPDPDPSAESFYRIRNGNVTKLADLGAFEAAENPDGGIIESNPFDLAKLSRNKFVVADAAGNSILAVSKNGDIELIATLPPLGPDGPEAVPTTVAIGPDGDIYVGELTGFPPTPGTSRVWRIEPDARDIQCQVDAGEDDDCTLVNTGPLTSIIDINFGEDGTAYVVELDEATWLAAEGPGGLGGTVNACRSPGGGDGDDDGVSWSCEVIATGLPFPLAVVADDKSVYVTLTLGPEGPVEVARLTAANGNGREDEHDGDDD